MHWFDNLVNKFNHPGIEILEIGSREVIGNSNAKKVLIKQIILGLITILEMMLT